MRKRVFTLWSACIAGNLKINNHVFIHQIKNQKVNKFLPLGLIDNAVLKKEINKDKIIRLNDVELNLPKEVIDARDYQYNLI